MQYHLPLIIEGNQNDCALEVFSLDIVTVVSRIPEIFGQPHATEPQL